MIIIILLIVIIQFYGNIFDFINQCIYFSARTWNYIILNTIIYLSAPLFSNILKFMFINNDFNIIEIRQKMMSRYCPIKVKHQRLLIHYSKTLFISNFTSFYPTFINTLLKFIKLFLIMWFLKFHLIIYYTLAFRNSYY